MRYSVAQNLDDFGFAFLEKIHEPIFLVTREGETLKMNEAARKFLSVTHLTSKHIQNIIQTHLETLKVSKETFSRFKLSDLHFIARCLPASELILVEVQH